MTRLVQGEFGLQPVIHNLDETFGVMMAAFFDGRLGQYQSLARA